MRPPGLPRCGASRSRLVWSAAPQRRSPKPCVSSPHRVNRWPRLVLRQTPQAAQYAHQRARAMSEASARPYLFLSHSGADADAARALKRRLLDSPDARAAGLRVWLDKDDLAAGLGWQTQLEKVISEEATAFAVHVGAKGVVNWVENEVRLGLSRATGAPDYPFIPILSRECSGTAALPPFVRQYHGVRDPLNDAEEFASFCALCCTDRQARKRSRLTVRLLVSKQ